MSVAVQNTLSTVLRTSPTALLACPDPDAELGASRRRTIYGQDCIFFGPFAGFTPSMFKHSGTFIDWLATMNPWNLIPQVRRILCRAHPRQSARTDE